MDSKVAKKEKINVENFSIGENHFSSVEEALTFLRDIYKKIKLAQDEDSIRASLYDGWTKNVVACANFLKAQQKAWQQPELF